MPIEAVDRNRSSRRVRPWHLVIVALLLAGLGCQAPRPAAPPAAQQSTTSTAAAPDGWDSLVEAARKEGQVSLAAFSGASYRAPLVEAFQRAYPGITVQAHFAPASDTVTRIQAERTAGKYLTDLMINGTGPSLIILKPAGIAAPLAPVLRLPEVVDESKWFENRHWWADSGEPYTTLMFQGSVQPVVAYNTTMVDPSEFRTYWDLLNPKWKSRIVSTDIRNPGPGAVSARFMFKEPSLGPEFLDRLFSEQDLTLSTDQRQMIDWLAQGRFPLALFLFGAEVSRAAELGLPVAIIPGERFKEGAVMGPSAGAITLIDRGPNPNATTLYVNWLLSREGQTIWQKETRETSLRVDIPKDGLLPFDSPRPGARYVNAATEEYARVSPTELVGLLNRAIEKKQ
jgi:iron(III) transport system substrate-binding protein